MRIPADSAVESGYPCRLWTQGPEEWTSLVRESAVAARTDLDWTLPLLRAGTRTA
jgi:hypothetical protein